MCLEIFNLKFSILNLLSLYFRSMEPSYLFLAILPFIAFLYASVGHGGASGYLALMALFSFAPETMKPTALLLNLFVAAISFIHFAQAGFFRMRLFLVFALLSVPMSFLGGMLEMEPHIYKIILGLFLLIAIVRMLGWVGSVSETKQKTKWLPGLAIGGGIGFFSGLIGIGGGIILSPVILLLRWGNVKEAAATSALFIWVNSAAGISGQVYAGVAIPTNAWYMVLIAVAGAFVGGYVGSQRWNSTALRYALAFVLFLASVKLIGTSV